MHTYMHTYLYILINMHKSIYFYLCVWERERVVFLTSSPMTTKYYMSISTKQEHYSVVLWHHLPSLKVNVNTTPIRWCSNFSDCPNNVPFLTLLQAHPLPHCSPFCSSSPSFPDSVLLTVLRNTDSHSPGRHLTWMPHVSSHSWQKIWINDVVLFPMYHIRRLYYTNLLTIGDVNLVTWSNLFPPSPPLWGHHFPLVFD